ncbi:unnamed protein product [Heterobilharzia americana]|nr:unnamed protein product [Heterobilharzia americana]
MQNMSYIADVLCIQNPIHKRKLMLRALDIILFGPPRQSLLVPGNASFVTLSLGLLCISIVSFSHWFYHTPSSERNLIGEKQEKLNSAEQTLKQLQKRLDDVEHLRQTLNAYELNHRFASSSAFLSTASQRVNRENLSSFNPMNTGTFGEQCLPIHKQSCGQLPHISNSVMELSFLTDSLNESVHSNVLNPSIHSDDDPSNNDQAHSFQHNKSGYLKERNLRNSPGNEFYIPSASASNRSAKCNSSEFRYELKHWLQVTYELELKRFCEKKIEAEKKLNIARQACIRFNRKRYTVFGSVRLVHTDNLDELEKRLIIAKVALDQLQTEVQERVNRWSRIEALTGHLIRTDVYNEHGKNIVCEMVNPTHYSVDKNNKYTDIDIKMNNSDHLFAVEQTLPEAKLVPKQTSNNSVNNFDCIHEELSFSSKESVQFNNETGDCSKTVLPRNYSFVRPFATLWRRKTKSGRRKTDSK